MCQYENSLDNRIITKLNPKKKKIQYYAMYIQKHHAAAL